MTDFFTPIEVAEVVHVGPEIYDPSKYEGDPFMPAQVKIESLADNRRKIMQWYV